MYVESLREFHEAFGHHIEEQPVAEVPREVFELRVKLIDEEWKETREAMQKGDLIGIADGLADLLYVVFGTAVSYGIPIDEVFKVVHAANMSKLWPDGKTKKNEYGKSIKPPGWKSPEEEIEKLLS